MQWAYTSIDNKLLKYGALFCASKFVVDGSMAFVICHLHFLAKICINFSKKKITLESI
jgi:ribosome biogenesis protein Nip4